MFNRLKIILILAILCSLSGCQSTAKSKYDEQSNLVKIDKQELAALQQSAAQWQQMKPQLERLLLIEKDLQLLVDQLASLTEPQQTAADIDQQPAMALASTKQPEFALQLASVTDVNRLELRLAELQNQVPALFSEQLIANVEIADIKGVTYYRLKIGAYHQKQQADDDCQQLKKNGVSCLVSYYTDKPLQRK